MRLSITLSALAVIMAPLGACDTKPNAKFEESYKDASERRAGDKFSALDNAGRQLTSYLQADETVKATYLASFAESTPAAVSTALTTLTDLPVGAHDAVAAQCRAAIEGGLAFRSATPPAPERVAAAHALYEALNTCRQAANAAEDAASGEVAEALQGWRRTASATMTSLGTTLVQRGDEADGVRLWREAEKAAQADRPGKRLSPQDFYYSMR